MDRTMMIEEDGKWRNDHGIDAERTILDGKKAGSSADARYDAY